IACRRGRRRERLGPAAPRSGRGRRRRRAQACSPGSDAIALPWGAVSTLSPPEERLDTGNETGLDRPWLVIVLNDNHNTFEGVAFALSAVLPGVDYDGGMGLAAQRQQNPA